MTAFFKTLLDEPEKREEFAINLLKLLTSIWFAKFILGNSYTELQPDLDNWFNGNNTIRILAIAALTIGSWYFIWDFLNGFILGLVIAFLSGFGNDKKHFYRMCNSLGAGKLSDNEEFIQELSYGIHNVADELREMDINEAHTFLGGSRVRMYFELLLWVYIALIIEDAIPLWLSIVMGSLLLLSLVGQVSLFKANHYIHSHFLKVKRDIFFQEYKFTARKAILSSDYLSSKFDIKCIGKNIILTPKEESNGNNKVAIRINYFPNEKIGLQYFDNLKPKPTNLDDQMFEIFLTNVRGSKIRGFDEDRYQLVSVNLSEEIVEQVESIIWHRVTEKR